MARKTLAERLAHGAETPEERRERMVAQAKAMRDARTLKRAQAHVCKPSETDEALTSLHKVLDRVARGNMAPIPIALALEGTEWTVDISVRIPGVADYEVSTSHESLATAITNAHRLLSGNREDNEARSKRAASRYGYEV